MAINWPWKKKEKPAKRMYAAAQSGRLFGDWVAGGTSADSEIKSSLPRVRNRSRQLLRDNDYAKNAVRVIANNVVGQGVNFQAQVKMQRGSKLDTKINDQIEREFSKWKKKQNCHAAGMLHFQDIERQLIEGLVRDGEVLVRLITKAMGDSKVPLALEVIEPDMLDDSYNDTLSNGNKIKMGVERNEWNRPVAYHFFGSHPGDDGFASLKERTNQRVRIPAEEVHHLFLQERASQTRGFPWLASTMIRMHQLQGYEEAEVISSRATASLMGFIESPDGEIPSDGVQDGERITDFQPGVFKYLAPGEKVNVPNMSRPGGTFDPFVRAMLRGVAAGIGISYESLTRDYSQGSYSSARQALVEDRDQYRVLQWWLIRNFHEPIFEKWLDLAVLSGALNLKGYENNPEAFKSCRWMPRGWSWIDPAKEVQAYKDAVRCGFATQSEVIAQAGGDIEEVFRARASEIELAESLGLKFDTEVEDISTPDPQPAQDNSNDMSGVE